MHYIYNGKVQIHQDGLDRFLEIAQGKLLNEILKDEKLSISKVNGKVPRRVSEVTDNSLKMSCLFNSSSIK